MSQYINYDESRKDFETSVRNLIEGKETDTERVSAIMWAFDSLPITACPTANTINVKPNDTIILEFTHGSVRPKEAGEMIDFMRLEYPNNNVIGKFEDVEITLKNKNT